MLYIELDIGQGLLHSLYLLQRLMQLERAGTR
jgi:hypothetical protein